MDKHLILICVMAVIASVNGCPMGRKFVTAFLTNHLGTNGKLQLAVTAQDLAATVKVEVPAIDFKKTVQIEKQATTWVDLPSSAELSGPGTSKKVVMVTSDQHVSVVSSNIKPFSGDSSVIFPSSDLGKKYVVFTPNTGPREFDKLVAIVNQGEANTVDILPTSNVEVKGMKPWKTGEKFTLQLAPYEVYQFQSQSTLSGTVITSKLPLAALAGHQCSKAFGTCEHVYEQLVPVERLSTNYLVPAMQWLIGTDTAYVVSPEDDTQVTISDGKEYKRKLNTGDVWNFNVKKNTPVIVNSNKKVMVMYYGTNHPYDEFLTNVIPTSEFSSSWSIYLLDGYESTAVVVVEAEASDTMKDVTKWTPFPSDHNYVMGFMPLTKLKGAVTVSGNAVMAVYIYGGKVRYGYGTTGVCRTAGIQDTVTVPPPPDPCETLICPKKQQCKNGACVPVATATCSALGDPHYRTFDGTRFDFQGTCTYTMAKVKDIPNHTPFTVLAKNEHRGNKWVSFVRKVTVIVYDYTVVISGQKGQVQVNDENTFLPVSLAGGKIQVAQQGRTATVSTDFGLEVKYDWNSMLYITAPIKYFSALGGLCGNYNGNRKDEWTAPSGTQLSTVLEFAKSWKVDDKDLFCIDDCQGKCPSCSEAQQVKYKSTKHCGILNKADGPFAIGHKTIDPEMYLNNCVYDVCMNKGVRTFLCDNLASYVDACMAERVKISSNWRTVAGCPLTCPPNSHYEACGTACAPSCSDRDASAKCLLPCVEGCQCDKGYVLSGENCVPVKTCGCVYEGRYYQPQKFWGDEKCTKRCTCSSGQVKCTDGHHCKKSEICAVRNGDRDCYPESFTTCWASGDPHYHTFDGKKFDFQGTCTYVLSKLVGTTDPSLEPFEVQVQNENRGQNKAVAYTKTVQISVYGYTIIMSTDNLNKVMLNNLYVNLPMDDGRISIFRKGQFGVVKTNFGLKVEFNWIAYVAVTLPSTYKGVVGGLCGNYNSDITDDLSLPDKTPAKTPTIFGASWKVKDNPGCSNECQGKNCPMCDEVALRKTEYSLPCKIITNPIGPFKDCHGKVKAEPFYDNCVYDVCMYQGHSSAICNAVSAYAAACQGVQANVERWRNVTFCPLSCKANSHYEVCGSSCPQTCSGLSEPVACEASCTEGCVCEDGFVLSDGECVSQENCGCMYEGQYYQLGQTYFPNGQCKTRCVCKQDGKMECDNTFKCAPNEKCQIKDGKQACYSIGAGTCTVSGSGNFQTFDGKAFSVSGDCRFKLAATLEMEEAEEEKPSFSVTVLQVSQTADVLVTRSITINIYNYNITMLPGLLKIMVDGTTKNLPLDLDDGKVEVSQNGLQLLLQTDFGLKVTYDTISTARVEIPSSYKGDVGGLCGNYNDNQADDFLLPEKVMASSPEKFAAGWVDEHVTCHIGCGSKCPVPDKEKEKEATVACAILTSTSGPFSDCHATVPPKNAFDDCVKDMAAQGGNHVVLCYHLRNYVALCQSSGSSIRSWRSTNFCPLDCPKNSHYELCADSCSSSCASLFMTQKCSRCQEGCQCDYGFAFDGVDCVPLENCGCLADGQFYRAGETVMDEDCTTKCSCTSGMYSCEPVQCRPNQICEIIEGVRDCYGSDPCDAVACHEMETCIIEKDKATCIPKSKASCWAMGDPEFQTFDGKVFFFQGTCTYTMVQTTGTDKTLKPFSVVTVNKMHGNSRGSYIKTAVITVKNHEITVLYGEPGKLTIDGVISHIPVTLPSDGIQILMNGFKGIMKTDFGVEVTFDWAELLMVTVSSSYFRNLQGLCGNYNNDTTDDFTMANGKLTPNTAEWAESWSQPDSDNSCLHSCQGQCPSCSVEDDALYKGTSYCGVIEDESGPFSSCHDKVPPERLAADCLYHVCQHGGKKEVLCKALGNYAEVCQLSGITVSPQWKANCSD